MKTPPPPPIRFSDDGNDMPAVGVCPSSNIDGVGSCGAPTRNLFTVEMGQQDAIDRIKALAEHPLMVALGRGNDKGRAMALLLQEQDNLRWCPGYGAWYVWRDSRWELDTRAYPESMVSNLEAAALAIVEEAHDIAFKARLLGGAGETGSAGEKKQAKQVQDILERMRKNAVVLGNSTAINSTIAVTKLQQEIVVNSDDLDKDPWLVGVQNGILNLRTGEFSPADRSLLVTKRLGVNYEPGATCPKWEKFLQDILQGDVELIGYLQQALGYTITGLMGEQVFWFLYGTGKNGKSTFVETLQTLGGDYLLKSPETLLAREAKGREPSRDIALLPGVRVLLGNETNSDVRLNTNVVKAITGGDTMSGTPLYAKSFHFKPSAKLWMYGNHKPTIPEQDEGIWRRVILVPFEYEVPESKRDRDLDTKLQAELPGILNWVIEGLRRWQEAGCRLRHPARIQELVAEYRKDEDNLGNFIEACIVATGAGTRIEKAKVFNAYKLWAEAEGIRVPMSSWLLSRKLKNRKSPKWEGDSRYWFGVGLEPGSPFVLG